MYTLYEADGHKNICVNDLSFAHMVDSNQHIIVHNNEAMLLDPGGHKIFTKLFTEITSLTSINNLKYIFFSHQDPDIIAAANGWLMTTSARGLLPEIWMRFITHFGVDKMVLNQITPIPDDGLAVNLGGCELKLIPAHFLHSPGNFQVYDPQARILYSGDLGASVGGKNQFVEDFDHHIQFMEGFHHRYMPGTKPLKMWVNTVRQLEIDTIAPQHGGVFAGPEMVQRFIDWVDSLECGFDRLGDSYPIP
ncbi:MAG: MBL fold metallo-hydrolase [Desulfobulbaceae bacterium]|nr:MAG: MBL fold metallo-hydrolase [Desulfobulbaceae bacterium]